MNNISDKELDKLAHLARLSFEGDERIQIKNELAKIISFCEKLNQINTEGIEPLIYVTPTLNNVREDVVQQVITKEEALKNAPMKDSDFFRIPKVISEKK
jgi:aspartyl-tRNA(Asn)/glutamyl-tRNA(Gln) amidotransferase subunit C